MLSVGVGLLRSPLHGLASGRIVLLAFTGRRSGRRFAVPVSYLHYGGDILGFTSGGWSAWWKNLRGGAPVKARVRGRRISGSVWAETNGDAVVRGLDTFLYRVSRQGRALRRGAPRRRAARSAERGSGRQGGKGGNGGRGFAVALVSAAVSPATASSVPPAAPTAVEPTAAVVAASVVPAVVAAAAVAASAEEAVVAGARPRAGSSPTAAAVAAPAADQVRADAEDYAYRDHEQDDQKQFHGTVLPVDAPGCKIVVYPCASVRYNSIVPPCARARVVY